MNRCCRGFYFCIVLRWRVWCRGSALSRGVGFYPGFMYALTFVLDNSSAVTLLLCDSAIHFLLVMEVVCRRSDNTQQRRRTRHDSRQTLCRIERSHYY